MPGITAPTSSWARSYGTSPAKATRGPFTSRPSIAAGTLGSTEILLRSHARGLPLSSAVGTRFSGNGDVLGFAYHTSDRVDGISTGSHSPAQPAVGPCITSIIDMRNTD